VVVMLLLVPVPPTPVPASGLLTDALLGELQDVSRI
jgi:hypothetical protein